MNEITRIHLARTPFNVEVAAKKELEKYLVAIEKALQADNDAMREIEGRIVELLTEHGITSDKTVTTADVERIKEQLGDPGEFIDEQDAEQSVRTGDKRLMRDTEHGLLGGVLAGLGAYFGIEVIWLRLAAVILALISFGTAIVVYAVLWIVMPEAKTAADKLQMAGQAVTLEALKKQSQSADMPAGAKPFVIILRALLGLGFVGLAVAAFGLLGVALTAAVMYMSPDAQALMNAWLVAAFILAVASGLLLVIFSGLSAYVSFAWRLSKRVGVALVVMAVVGLAMFGTAVGLGVYGGQQLRASIDRQTHTQRIALSQWADIKALAATNADVPIEYKVTQGTPYAELKTVSVKGGSPTVKATREGTKGMLGVDRLKDHDYCMNSFWRQLCISNSVLTVYGPALDYVESDNGRLQYQAADQAELSVVTKPDTTVKLTGGTIAHVNAQVGRDSIFNGEDAAITRADVNVGINASVRLGILSDVQLTLPEGCAARDVATVGIERVTRLSYGGGVVSQASELNENCARISLEEPRF